MRHIVVALLLGLAGAIADARSLVVTQQSVSYELPKDWTVKRWTEKTGEAISTNAATSYLMEVERHGTAGTPLDYPNSESLTGGRTLKWDYSESFPKSGQFVLQGEVIFPDPKVGATVRIYIFSPDKPTGVAKDASLVVLRAVASSVKVLGARKCWPPGECPPGVVHAIK